VKAARVKSDKAGKPKKKVKKGEVEKSDKIYEKVPPFDEMHPIPKALKSHVYIYTAGSSKEEVRRYYAIYNTARVNLASLVNGKYKIVKKNLPYREFMKSLPKLNPSDRILLPGMKPSNIDIIPTDPKRVVFERVVILEDGRSITPQIKKNHVLYAQIPQLPIEDEEDIYYDKDLYTLKDVVNAILDKYRRK
jgi:hypothetical protein